MKQKNFFRSKGIVSTVIIVVLAVVVIGFYRVNNSRDYSESKINATITVLPTAIAVTPPAISPISPVSPPPPIVAEKTDPSEIEALVQNAITLYKNQDYQAAIDVLNEVLTLDPNNALAYNARGSVYLDSEDYSKAIIDYTKAIESDPLLPHAYYNRGRAHSFLKQYDKAIADLQESIKLSPAEFGYRANGNIGLIYHQQSEYDKALVTFTEAMSSDDSKADTYYLRGETYTAMGNYEAAISDYEAATSRFPDYYQAYQSLGYAHYKNGQFDQALEALNKAIELSPNSPAAHFYLMLVYLATDQGDKAQTEVSQAMDAIGALVKEEQNALFKRVLADLETFAQENPTQAKNSEAIINLIPQPQ